MLRILLLLPAFILAWSSPAPAAEVSVSVSRDGEALRVEASAELDAGLLDTWAVLTDYGRLAEFIPDMLESRVVGRGGRGPLIDQRGEARILFLSFAFSVRLAVDEFPYERITSRAVSGSFKHMEGAYVLEAAAGRTRLTYTGILVPDFFVPPLIGTLVIRLVVERQFSALVDEILRRRELSVRKFPS